MQHCTPASLVLSNGAVFRGFSFGHEHPTAGEVVFNTAMTGYPESLTDPSYSGQILTFTYPLIGNYGVPGGGIHDRVADFYESEKICVEGVVISDYSFAYSHWNAVESLADWLKRSNVPGIFGIDTRCLTKMLREEGSMKGKILIDGMPDVDFVDPNLENQVAKVSCREVIKYGGGGKKVVMIDCGVKHNILRCFIKRGVELWRVPWDHELGSLIKEADGLFISNGPGDPGLCGKTVEQIRLFMAADKPIWGICMGNQLLSMAGGAKTYKLKYGHRSHNQPVRRVGTNQCFITSQNHGFAVDNATLGSDWEPLFVNMNDDTNEGIRHKTKPWFSCQFHPEAASGPTDTEFMFDEFISLL